MNNNSYLAGSPNGPNVSDDQSMEQMVEWLMDVNKIARPEDLEQYEQWLQLQKAQKAPIQGQAAIQVQEPQNQEDEMMEVDGDGDGVDTNDANNDSGNVTGNVSGNNNGNDNANDSMMEVDDVEVFEDGNLLPPWSPSPSEYSDDEEGSVWGRGWDDIKWSGF